MRTQKHRKVLPEVTSFRRACGYVCTSGRAAADHEKSSWLLERPGRWELSWAFVTVENETFPTSVPMWTSPGYPLSHAEAELQLAVVTLACHCRQGLQGPCLPVGVGVTLQ